MRGCRAIVYCFKNAKAGWVAGWCLRKCWSFNCAANTALSFIPYQQGHKSINNNGTLACFNAAIKACNGCAAKSLRNKPKDIKRQSWPI